jgi:hypothetical protein
MGVLSFKHRWAPARLATGFRRHLPTASVLIVLLGAPTCASAAAPKPISRAQPAGSIGVQLLNAPIAARNDPRARLYIVDHLRPGTVIRRQIEVSNTTASTRRIAMYVAAATITNGRFVGAAGHTPNDLSTWTSVRPRASDVRAGGHATATVTIAVPRDAAPGEQYGVVWAEVRSAPPAGGGITQVSRVGIRLYLSVGPGGPPASKFTIESLTAERSLDGRPMVVATVHNTGGRALDMSGTLQLSAGPGGLRAGPFAANLGVTLRIGDTEPVTVILDKRLPNGPWAARVTLHSGLTERSKQSTITFPAITSPSPPYPAIAALIAVLLLGIVAVRVLTRR